MKFWKWFLSVSLLLYLFFLLILQYIGLREVAEFHLGLLVALGTLGAVVVALFGDHLREIINSRFVVVGYKVIDRSIYLTIKTSDHRIVSNCQVKVIKCSGDDFIDEGDLPLVLKWAGIDEFYSQISKEDRRVEFLKSGKDHLSMENSWALQKRDIRRANRVKSGAINSIIARVWDTYYLNKGDKVEVVVEVSASVPIANSVHAISIDLTNAELVSESKDKEYMILDEDIIKVTEFN